MGPRSSSLRLTLLPFVGDGMGGSAYFEQIVSVAETDQLASRSSIASIALAFEVAVRLPMGSAPSRGRAATLLRDLERPSGCYSGSRFPLTRRQSSTTRADCSVVVVADTAHHGQNVSSTKNS